MNDLATRFLNEILSPGLDEFCAFDRIPHSPDATRFLLAIAIQESDLRHRAQLGQIRTSALAKPGPARGWWHFERGGHVVGVLNHPRTEDLAKLWGNRCWVDPNSNTVWRALEGHDRLAVGFARMLVWTSPNKLPDTEASGWQQYAHELWLPGKPHRDRWKKSWADASEAVF